LKNESTPPLTNATITAQLEKPQFHHAAGILQAVRQSDLSELELAIRNRRFVEELLCTEHKGTSQ